MIGRLLRQGWRALAGVALGMSLSAPSFAASALGEEYERVDYTGAATRNAVARLAERMERGETVLVWTDERGYLDSFLDALGISPGSQVLVFSATSLQYKLISSKTPRALYFNDHTYVGYVQNSSIVEVATMDAEKGLVFYVFNNSRKDGQPFERTNGQCLVCHDSQGAMGGGVPVLMALSSLYTDDNRLLMTLTPTGGINDRTPVDERWGGWYVSGWNGSQPHLGNIVGVPRPGTAAQVAEAKARNGNLVTLDGAGFFDTAPYVRPTSDMVALLVLEHQLTVQNQLTYVKFKAPSVLARHGLEEAARAPSWDALPAQAQRILTRMLDALVDTLFFADAAVYKDRIAGLREYEDWFRAQGPRDGQGRSLRDLDLGRRLLAYPLSYLIYTEDFEGLPAYAKDYVRQRIAGVLENRAGAPDYPHLSALDRRAIREILLDTWPQFRPYAGNVAEVSAR